MTEPLPIWEGVIPYNTGRPKAERLRVDPALPPEAAMAAVFDPAHSAATAREFDTAVWHTAILPGRVSQNFDDVPHLTPYPVPGSRICVLLCGGGAYLDVSQEDEAAPVARELNRHGITAFSLRYRTYPYRAPAMFLDCRRAVCWLRAHAGEYGFDPGKLCLGGFSAGGHLAAATALLFREIPAMPGREPDAVDRQNARPDALLLVYPQVDFSHGADLLLPLLGEEAYRACPADAVRRWSLPPQLTEDSPPAFLVGAADDTVTGAWQLLSYAERCQSLEIPFELHVFREGGHGFGSARNRSFSPYAPPGDYRGTDSWTDLFALWLEKTFSPPGSRQYR